MTKATINGTDMEYEITGGGEPLLLISTGPIADSFLPLVAEKALTDLSLVRYHQRRWAAGPNSSPVSFGQHANDAAALLAHLGISRAHVAGHSTGAAIALQLVTDHPNRVASLTLLEPPLLGVASAGAFFEKAGPALAAYGADDKEKAIKLFLSVVCSLEWDECSRVIESRVPGGVARAIEDADNFFGSYLPALSAWQFGPEQAVKLRLPALSVLGTKTEALFKDSHRLLHDWFPQLEDCIVEGVAHLLHLERPEPIATGIAEFLRRHPLRGKSASGAEKGSGRPDAEHAPGGPLQNAL